MSGDFSRVSFDPWADLCGVLAQQGKVQLDADANALMAIFERRFRAGTMDTLGKAAVPRETPDGFRIDVAGGGLLIHPGRIYVDGILAENHGSGAPGWEAHLAELARPEPVDYDKQPYFPDPPEIGPNGPQVVYLDVWQRELTHLQKPDLVEKGLGVDTIAALQTVWQVKAWPAGEIDVWCDTPFADLPGWDAANGPSGARLSTAAHEEAGPENPCLAPPGGGYTGIENQLYRIEIHTGGGADEARFKWSRDNASVAARVLTISGDSTLVLDSIGKDALLRFSDGDWVEVTDDWRELKGLPGEMRRIKLGDGVDDATRTVVLEQPLPALAFPVDTQGNTQEERHTRIVRWDQKGKVLREDGTLLVDLDAAGSDGLVPVPPAGTRVRIEQGVLAKWSVADGAAFRPLDHWTFAARSADASVEELSEAPPRGIHHHYAKLAIVTLPDKETSCRILWPPEAGAGDCACTVCVDPDGHNSGKATIHEAVASLEASGGTVCLKPGVYRLARPISLKSRAGVVVRGHGTSTILAGANPGTLVQVEGARAAALENMVLVGVPNVDISYLVTVENVSGFRLRDVFALALTPEEGRPADVLRLTGIALGVEVSHCVFLGGHAIGFSPIGAHESFLLGADLTVEDNLLLASRRGISLEGPILFGGRLRVGRNVVMGASETGIRLGGANVEAADIVIVDNVLRVAGTGIGVGLGDATISGNLYAPAGGDGAGYVAGVALLPGMSPKGMRHLQVCGNRILGGVQAGITSAVAVESAAVTGNLVENAGELGIAFDAGAASGDLTIAGNRLTAIGREAGAEDASCCAIRVVSARRAQIRDNVVTAVARGAVSARTVAAISAMQVDDVSIAGNSVAGIGPPQGFIGDVAGILLAGPALDARVRNNSVRRRGDNETKKGNGRWCGIRIPGFNEGPEVVFLAPALGTVFIDGEALALLGDRTVDFIGRDRNVTVSGNRVQAQDSLAPYVWVTGVRTCIFAENQVEVAPGGFPFEPLVQLERGAFTVQANVIRSKGDAIALVINFASAALAIGNLSTGQLVFGGGPLPPPMPELNLIIS